ncbi:MAG TPA: NAD-dependent epimerase/dehydratase family protein [Candidatus Acidoferrales bacterium]|nr:NAD-dependent epimerase/dehydratase family protein [Candidatus Acidoferrales bacterium]
MEAVVDKVALFGAAGAIGQSVAPELERRGIAFRAVGRSREKLDRAFSGLPHAEVFPADLGDLRSAGAAARGIDTIIYCVGLPYPSHHLHPQLMRTTLQAARSEGVRRLVLVSSVYAFGVPRTSRVAETHPREPHTAKGRYRKDQEDLVLAAHASGALQTMIVRLPDFYGPHADLGLAPLVFQAALAGKTVNWPGVVNTAHEFVFVPDTGPVIAELAARDDCYGDAWHYGGPGSINTLDFITRVYRAAGHAPKYRAAGKTLLRIAGWFDPNIREVIEMLYLQETPLILDDAKLVSRLCAVHKTPYDQGIRETLDRMHAVVHSS